MIYLVYISFMWNLLSHTFLYTFLSHPFSHTKQAQKSKSFCLYFSPLNQYNRITYSVSTCYSPPSHPHLLRTPHIWAENSHIKSSKNLSILYLFRYIQNMKRGEQVHSSSTYNLYRVCANTCVSICVHKNISQLWSCCTKLYGSLLYFFFIFFYSSLFYFSIFFFFIFISSLYHYRTFGIDLRLYFYFIFLFGSCNSNNFSFRLWPLFFVLFQQKTNTHTHTQHF